MLLAQPELSRALQREALIDGTDFGDNILATLPDIVTSLLSYGLEEVSKPTIIDGVITIGGSVEKDGLPGGWGATAPLTSTTKLGIREDVMHFDIAPAVD